MMEKFTQWWLGYVAHLRNKRRKCIPGLVAAITLLALVNMAYGQTHVGSLQHNTGGAQLMSPSAVFVSGNYAYVASYSSNALEIVDISDPSLPVHKGSLTHGTDGALLLAPSSIVVSGNYAYVASRNSGSP
jgi:hypothetical protein